MADTAAAAQSGPFITQITNSNGPDPDELEAQEARAELERESSAAPKDEGTPPGPPEAKEPPAAAEGGQPPSGEAGGASAQPAAAPAKQPDGEPTTIPYARFKEVNDRARSEAEARRVAEQRAAYFEGRLSAAQPQNTAPKPDPKVEIQNRRQAARDALAQSATKLDGGEIGQSDHEKARFAYEDAMEAIRADEVNLNRPPPRPNQPAPTTRSIADEQILERHVVELETKHPYAAVLTPQQATEIAARAQDLARSRGIPITSDAHGDMRLRELAAELSDYWGPRWHPDLQLPQPTPTEPPAEQPQQPTQLSPEAQARTAKLALAANHPPDTATLGAAGSDASTVPTAAQIEQMSDEAIAALPQATRTRILEGNS